MPAPVVGIGATPPGAAMPPIEKQVGWAALFCGKRSDKPRVSVWFVLEKRWSESNLCRDKREGRGKGERGLDGRGEEKGGGEHQV